MYSRVTSTRLVKYRNIIIHTYSSSVQYIIAYVYTYSRQNRQRSKLLIVLCHLGGSNQVVCYWRVDCGRLMMMQFCKEDNFSEIKLNKILICYTH